MDDFPEFMKPHANRIAASSQATAEVEGFGREPDGLLDVPRSRTVHAVCA
jgi:hypothetical protein